MSITGKIKTISSEGTFNKNAMGKVSFFQPKLTINQPNDIYEQEADAMADKVMRMPSNKNESTFFKSANISSLQRKCAHCEEEEKLQMKSDGGASSSTQAPSIVHDVISSGGQPLDTTTRNFFEPRFGHDFSNVRIHNDSTAAKSAQSINALAYTTGDNIVFNQNQFSPETYSGKKLLAHELTHVVQQTDQKKTFLPESKQNHLECKRKELVQTQSSAASASPQELMDEANTYRLSLLQRADFRIRQLQIACEEQGDSSLLIQALPEEVGAFVAFLGIFPWDENFCAIVSLIKSDISKNLNMDMLPFFFANETDEFCQLKQFLLANYEGYQIRICPVLVDTESCSPSLRALTLIHEIFHEPSFAMSHPTLDEMNSSNCGFLGSEKAISNPYCVTNIIGRLGGNVIY